MERLRPARRRIDLHAAGVPSLDRVGTFLCAPLYALMNLGLLIPLRFYALATMRDGSWGTRATVEVGDAPEPEAATVEFATQPLQHAA